MIYNLQSIYNGMIYCVEIHREKTCFNTNNNNVGVDGTMHVWIEKYHYPSRTVHYYPLKISLMNFALVIVCLLVRIFRIQSKNRLIFSPINVRQVKSM